MSSRAEVLIKEALALPDAERASLIDGLLAALEPENDAEVDLAWATEIERRGAELQQGRVTAIPWNEVREKALRLANAERKWCSLSSRSSG
jgi:putative addiction module component (TIGR02574 family)